MNKERALEIFKQHIELAAVDGTKFRRTVMDQLQAETGCTKSSAATLYNTAKKACPKIEGLGRETTAKSARKVSKITTLDEIPDEECFTVLELIQTDGSNFLVGRTQAFVLQGEASECFDSKVEAWPNTSWVLIQGLGPNPGDNFKLEPEEKEIRRVMTRMPRRVVVAPVEDCYT